VQLERGREPRHRAQHQPEDGKGDEHEHGEGAGAVGLDALRQLARVGGMQGIARLGGRRLQVGAAGLVQRGVVGLADLAAREDDRRRPGVLDQQALAHRPDEDKQPHDRQQEGAQQAQDGTVHRWVSFLVFRHARDAPFF
jgi:hypothetical protein